MKKRILSIVILALMVVGAFALVSCGKEEEEKCICETTLVEYQCEEKHSFYLCTNKDCIFYVGENTPICLEDNCGNALVKKMKFKLDFPALGESAMILCQGMLGIFIVTGVIIAFTLLLNTIVEKVKESKEKKE